MNLYALHNDPHSLIGNDKRILIPDIAWNEFEQDRRDGVADTSKYLPGILNSPKTAFKFAERIIKGKWPEAESIIAQDAEASHNYAEYILNGRFKQGEPAIITDPHWSSWYASGILRQRWPEAEPNILKDPRVAVRYACDTIKDRWPEAEPYIAKDAVQAFNYYTRVYKPVMGPGRWYEAEPALKADHEMWLRYTYRIDDK